MGRSVVRFGVLGLVVACEATAAAGEPPAKGADQKRVSEDACFSSFERTQELRKAGQLTLARSEAVICRDPACPEEIRAACFEWERELETQTPTVVFAVRDADGADVAGYSLELDGEPLAGALDGHGVAVDPGSHVVRFVGPGGEVEEREIAVAAGEKNRPVVLLLDRQQTTEAPSRFTPIVVGSGLVGLAGLGLAAAATFRSFDLKSELDDSGCAPNCTDEELAPLEAWTTTADVALVVGAVGLGTAVAFFIWGAPSGADETAARKFHVDVGAGPTGGQMLIRGAF